MLSINATLSQGYTPNECLLKSVCPMQLWNKCPVHAKAEVTVFMIKTKAFPNLLFLLVKMVATIKKAMAACHPLFLNEALEAGAGSVIGIQHNLDQAGQHAAQV